MLVYTSYVGRPTFSCFLFFSYRSCGIFIIRKLSDVRYTSTFCNPSFPITEFMENLEGQYDYFSKICNLSVKSP